VKQYEGSDPEATLHLSGRTQAAISLQAFPKSLCHTLIEVDP